MKNFRMDDPIDGYTKKRFICRYENQIVYWKLGKGDSVICIINAMGVSIDFWQRIIDRFIDDYTIIAWECRGILPEETDLNLSVRDHAEDLREIMRYEGIENAQVFTWSSGAKIAVEFYSIYPDCVKTLTFITGSFAPISGYEHLTTEYNEKMTFLAKLIDENPEIAKTYLSTVRNLFLGKDSNEKMFESLVSVVNIIDKDIREMIIKPFLNEATILSFARMMKDFYAHDISHAVGNIKVPTLVMGAEKDAVTHPQMSYVVSDKIVGSEYVQIPSATHYCILEKGDELAIAIKNFLKARMPSSEALMSS